MMAAVAVADSASIVGALSCGTSGCSCLRAQRSGKGLTHCPVHNDPSPSLSVAMRDGVLLVHCQAGCSQQAVIAALRTAQLWPETGASTPTPIYRRTAAASPVLGEPVALYRYVSAEGELVAEKGRWEDGAHKSFRWRRPGGSWADGIKPLTIADMPLWGAELLENQPDETVWFCEGEKATEACRVRGLLAVTCGGGAATKDFGASLDVLAGRRVVLWPDNDPPGREYAARVKARLEGLGCKVMSVAVAVPEKGDAWDYFAAGGTLDNLTQRIPSEPVLEFLADDVLRVRLSTVLGLLTVTCADIVKSPRAFDAEVTVHVLGPPERKAFNTRLNIQSLSQITELRRTLDNLGGDKDVGWLDILTTAFGLIREGFLNHDPSQDAADIEGAEDEQEFHVDVLAELGAPTVVFGDGSSGKSMFAAALALASAGGENFLGLDTVSGPWLYLDYEANSKTFGRRLRRLSGGYGLTGTPHGLVRYWPAKGIPLPDLVSALNTKIRRDGIVGIVVDSAAPACGGDPIDVEVVTRFFGALSKLGITAIVIAHITKNGDQHATQKPFGSGFWHHLARRTWYVERVQREGSDIVDLGIYNRKVNDGPQPPPLGVCLRFEGSNGPVTIARTDIRDVPELNAKRSLVDRVGDVLRGGEQTIRQLAEQVDEEPETISKCLRRYQDKRFRQVTQGGGRGVVATWGLIHLGEPVSGFSAGSRPTRNMDTNPDTSGAIDDLPF